MHGPELRLSLKWSGHHKEPKPRAAQRRAGNGLRALPCPWWGLWCEESQTSPGDLQPDRAQEGLAPAINTNNEQTGCWQLLHPHRTGLGSPSQTHADPRALVRWGVLAPGLPGGLRDPRPPRQGLEAQGAATQGCSCHQAGPGTHPWPRSATLWQPPARNGGCPRTPSQGPRRCLSLLMVPPGPLCPAVTPAHFRMSLHTPELLQGLFATPLASIPETPAAAARSGLLHAYPPLGSPYKGGGSLAPSSNSPDTWRHNKGNY